MEVIALSGYARSGKDEAAKVLVEEYGFTRVAFADKLRDVLYALNPIIIADPIPLRETGLPPTSTVQVVINEYGWNGYKETRWSKEIRRLLQRLGTEAGRQTLYDSIWVDAALTGHDDDARLVITDTRFENEAQAVKDAKGEVWRISRRGVGPVNNHSSETSLDFWNFDMIIQNDKTLEEFKERVRIAYAG